MLTIIIIMYCLPPIIALARRCDEAKSIILISLLLGWFPLVSLACLIWAIVGSAEQKQIDHAEMLAQAIARAQRGQERWADDSPSPSANTKQPAP